jgi:hypothetical protein
LQCAGRSASAQRAGSVESLHQLHSNFLQALARGLGSQRISFGDRKRNFVELSLNEVNILV